MAKPEQCCNCKKPATIHLTQIVNNKIKKVDLCDECPYKKGVTDSDGFSLADFLIKTPIGLSSNEEDQIECPTCHFTPADFKRVGRFGCPDCYENFSEMLKPMLNNMHKDAVHRGKIPTNAVARISFEKQKENVTRELNDAIQSENYELAAQLRDNLKKLERENHTYYPA